jgi:cytochrome c oxidase assembly protein subunit 15
VGPELLGTTELQRQRPVAVWLFICAGLLFTVLVVGGITRLTHSGLSIVEWHPLIGALPPFTHDAWEVLFASYRETPEFKLINHDMTLGGFREIFWWEYAHRLLGRLAGVVFLLPLIGFIVNRRISRTLASCLTAILLLGALQGALGWYMVASGLVNDPHVSQFRLTAHLGVALILIGAMLWTAMGLLSSTGAAARRVPVPAVTIAATVYLMALTGGMVAGTHAGLVYNTFPLMNGRLVPADILMMEPWYRNFSYNVATIQFVHRTVAWLLIVLIPCYWMWLRYGSRVGYARTASSFLLAAICIQAGLGISTLLTGVALPLSIAHQAGAVILFAIALWNAHACASAAQSPAPALTPANAPVGAPISQ